MATGILGRQNLSAASDTTLYTVPSDTFAVVSVSVVNRGASSANIRIAVSNSGTPADADYLEYDAEVLAKGVLERTGIVMDAGKVLVVRSSAINVNAVAVGIETATA